jgi:hypothetical protein
MCGRYGRTTAEKELARDRKIFRNCCDAEGVSEDAWGGPSLMYNLAAVYALTNEPSLAFEQSAILANSPGGMFYGQL